MHGAAKSYRRAMHGGTAHADAAGGGPARDADVSALATPPAMARQTRI